MINLENKAIVVTGAAAGLGRAYALALAEAGAAVMLGDVDRAGLQRLADQINAAGGRAEWDAGSVAEWDDCARLVERCFAAFERLDGLVNNAGVLHRAAPGDDQEDALRRIVDVNVLGALFMATLAFRAMREQGAGGVILNVTSGAHLGMSGLAAYGTTKGAVASLTYNLALDGPAAGIRVNALSPVAETAMSVDMPARDDGLTRPQPEDVAPVVVYLMSDQARQLNGQVVRFDGRALTLLDRPHFGGERVVRDRWTADTIADAFRSAIGKDLPPLGLYASVTSP